MLRRWGVGDAAALKRALDENVERLEPWIPWTVAAPGTLAEISARIETWSRAFDEGRHWIWALWLDDGRQLAGAVGVYPRDAGGRVLIAAADRAEIGYWLTAAATGHGFATEAARQAVVIARALPGVTRIEMRCDPANARSIAVPRRLGFREARRVSDPPAAPGQPPEESVVWELAVDEGGA